MSAIEKQKTGYSLRFRPLGKQVRVPVPVETKEQVVKTKEAVELACRSGQFSKLSGVEKDVARTSFEKSGFEVPAGLVLVTYEQRTPPGQMTFWEGVDKFVNYDGIAGTPALERHMVTLCHAVKIWGKNALIKNIWVPEIRRYMKKRRESPKVKKNGTLNRERGSLLKFFNVMIELQEIDKNPVKLIDRLSEKDGEREVYISYQDFLRIVDCASSRFPWFEPIVQSAYFGGMRRGEVINLTHKRLSLEDRLCYFGPKNTKEAAKKRVPIHKTLLEVLKRTVDLSKDHDLVFLINDSDGKGIRPPSKDSLKNPWRKIVDAVGLTPRPQLRDLRHTWKRNAFLSKIPERISETIMGHWYAEKKISRRYGWVSDEELIEAIDMLKLDHGPTHISDPSVYEET
jgi:integrase